MVDRAHLERLSRELTDQGKLIEAGWISLRLAAIPLSAPAVQLEEMRNAFFAGAQHLFSSLIAILDPGDVEPTEKDLERMDLIDAELKAFIKEFSAKNLPTEGIGLMGTALYDRVLAFNHGDAERDELMRKVWQGTPWMVDAYTGNYEDGRKREMLHWCYDTFGDQASPIHERPGTWQQGSATIYGWTWFGFAGRAQLEQFEARWPVPEGIRHPDAEMGKAG